MGRRTIQEQEYKSALKYYREGKKHSEVARLCGFARQTAIKAYNNGFPENGWPPIIQVLEHEKRAARVLLLEHENSRRDLERVNRSDEVQQAIQARLEEAKIVSQVRTESLKLLEILHILLPAAQSLAGKVKEKIEELLIDDEKLSVDAAISTLTRVITLSSKINDSAQIALQLERIHLGEPTQVIEIRDQEITLPEAELRINQAIRAIQNAKNAGGMTRYIPPNENPVIGKLVEKNPQ